jgi:hypothetical protein
MDGTVKQTCFKKIKSENIKSKYNINAFTNLHKIP